MTTIANANPNDSLPAGGITVRFRLIDIDNHWIENYRTDAIQSELRQLRDEIWSATDRKQFYCGVKSPLWGCWNKGRTKALLSAAFRRFECCLQIALRDLVKEYNEAMGYKEGDVGFVYIDGNPDGDKASPSTIARQKHRETIKQQGGDWAKKWDEALSQWTVEVHLEDYGDPDTDEAKHRAKGDNLIENTFHSEPSFFDTIHRVVLLKEANYKGADIASRLKLSPAAVSQYTNIFNLPKTLRETFSGVPLEKAWPDEEQRHEALATLESGIAEFIHRLKLSPKDPRVIEISKARDLMYGLTGDGEKEISLQDRLDLLAFTVKLDDSGKPTKHPTPDLKQINDNIKAKRALSKAPAVADTPMVPVTPEVEHKIISDAGAEAAKILAGELPATPVTTAPAPEAPPVKPVTQEAQPPATEGLVGDMQTQEQIAAANRAASMDLPPMEDLVDVPSPDIEEPTMEELMEGEVEEGLADEDEVADEMAAAAAATKPAVKTENVTGESKTKMTDAVANKYKVTGPETLERRANDHVKTTAAAEGASVFEVTSALAMANELFSAIGMTAQERKVNRAQIDYVDAANKWIEAMEFLLKATASQEDIDKVMALKPKYVAPSLV